MKCDICGSIMVTGDIDIQNLKKGVVYKCPSGHTSKLMSSGR